MDDPLHDPLVSTCWRELQHLVPEYSEIFKVEVGESSVCVPSIGQP